VATLNVIRRWALRDQMSIREISRRPGLARNTVKKHLRCGRERAQLPKAGNPKQARSLRREAGHLASDRGNKIAETAAHFEADPHNVISLRLETTAIGSKTALQRLNPKRRRSRTYPHREHLLFTKSVGQNSMENSGQTSAEFNSTPTVSTKTTPIQPGVVSGIRNRSHQGRPLIRSGGSTPCRSNMLPKYQGLCEFASKCAAMRSISRTEVRS